MADGLLLLDKGLVCSSNAALQKVKRLMHAKKAGHTGSLDPLASGMLPIALGEATKFAQYLLDSDKCYRAVLQLGIKTTTGDAEGEVIADRPVAAFLQATIENVLQTFRGESLQIPPMYSALKHQGQPLYRLARKGVHIERAPRKVHITELTLDAYQKDTLSLKIVCSKGTYIRVLAEDIGEALGCGAHLIELRRLWVAPFENATMYTLEELQERFQQGGLQALENCLLPMDAGLTALPKLDLNPEAWLAMQHGKTLSWPAQSPGCMRLYQQQRFVGIGEITEQQMLKPKRLVCFN